MSSNLVPSIPQDRALRKVTIFILYKRCKVIPVNLECWLDDVMTCDSKAE